MYAGSCFARNAARIYGISKNRVCLFSQRSHRLGDRCFKTTTKSSKIMANENYFIKCKSLDEAKQLYKKLCVKLHPDVSGYDSTADFQKMQADFENFRPGKEKFDGEFNQWDATEYAFLIDQLIKIGGISIEICGSWIWLSGDTKPVKEKIKSVDTGDTMRRGWSKNKGMWYFSPKGYRKRSGKQMEYEEIKTMFGSKTVKQKKKAVLK